MLPGVSDIGGVVILVHDLTAEVGVRWDIDSSFVVNDSISFPCLVWVLSELLVYRRFPSACLSDL